MDLKNYIGMRVKRARTVRGLTQEQLAEQVGKAIETISNIERGHAYTGLETLEAISLTLGVPIREFFEGAEDAKPKRPERVQLEQAILDELEALDDNGLNVTLDLARSLVRHEVD